MTAKRRKNLTQKGAMNSKLKDKGSVDEVTGQAMDSKLKDEGSVEEASVEAMDSKLKDEGISRRSNYRSNEQ